MQCLKIPTDSPQCGCIHSLPFSPVYFSGCVSLLSKGAGGKRGALKISRPRLAERGAETRQILARSRQIHDPQLTLPLPQTLRKNTSLAPKIRSSDLKHVFLIDF